MAEAASASPVARDAEPGRADFDTFFRAEYPRLFETLFLSGGDRALAEDLAQEAMVRALERWDRVASARSPAAYVYAIAFNLNRSRLRRLAVAIRHRSGTVSPADPAATVERRLEIRAALRSLPADQREALLLVHWVGMTSKEAGRVLGIDPASVRGRIHRARRELRARFGGLDD